MDDPKENQILAAIDIGSNSVRMALAQTLPDGTLEIFERLHRALYFGQDVFLRGRIGANSMRGAVAILTDYKRIISQYGATRIRVVATSALREASNADNFLDRVFLATRLPIEIIDVAEESRLTLSAIRRMEPESKSLDQGHALLVEPGGGNAILIFLENGEIDYIHGASSLGTIRITEKLLQGNESPTRRVEILTEHIRSSIGTSQILPKLQRCRTMVAIGSYARFTGRLTGTTVSGEMTGVHQISPETLDAMILNCAKESPEQLARRCHVEFFETETLLPAMIICRELLGRTACGELIVSSASMRDGVLADMALSASGCAETIRFEESRQSARAVAQRYRVDPEHAAGVAIVALQIFDALQSDHGLGPRERLLLELAAMLHEAGTIVSGNSWHKHSYYLIAHSDIFGLSRDETRTLAHIARYHRRSPPKPNHTEFQSLPREIRVLIWKLAAILRVADLLAPDRGVSPGRFRFEHRGDEFTIIDTEANDPGVEERL
ncbi:MAG: HD domain-containing protein, partial [Planctomycetia bacterium]|nr:HD domain-containing protein [Planctomycetia bacterium]